jgi:hypothetical protein
VSVSALQPCGQWETDLDHPPMRQCNRCNIQILTLKYNLFQQLTHEAMLSFKSMGIIQNRTGPLTRLITILYLRMNAQSTKWLKAYDKSFE